jgi:hypothetical protein
MKKREYIFLAIIATLLSLLLIKTEPIPGETIIKETVQIDTIVKTDTIYQPKYFYSEVINYDTVRNTDTVYILKDYNTKYSYSDTLVNDSSAFIVVNDIIYQNRIYSRENDISIFQKTITRTETLTAPKKWHIILAGGVTGNKNNFGFDIGGGVRTRSGTDVILGYDPVNGFYRVGISVVLR